MSRVVLVGGGVRSGKSAFALRRAFALGERRAFVATAQAWDDEMRARIARHVEERGDAFVTREAPIDVVEALRALRDVDVAVIDCLTLWLSNLLLRGDDEAAIATQVDALAVALREAPFASVVVTNEVGMGIVPETRLGRTFRDVAGRAHQRLARAADEVHVAILGVVLRVRPGPVAITEEA